MERQSGERLPALVPIRYGRMMESPFRFYRGAAAIMAADLRCQAHSSGTSNGWRPGSRSWPVERHLVQGAKPTVRACVRAYRERMREFAVIPILDIWHAQDDADHVQQRLVTESKGEA